MPCLAGHTQNAAVVAAVARITAAVEPKEKPDALGLWFRLMVIRGDEVFDADWISDSQCLRYIRDHIDESKQEHPEWVPDRFYGPFDTDRLLATA